MSTNTCDLSESIRNWRRFNPLVMQIVDTFEFDMQKNKGFTINYHNKQE